MTNAKHTMNSTEHYPLPHIIEMAKEVLGGIDFDPCSCAVANKIVGARTYATKEFDGLIVDWCGFPLQPGTVWCNPPESRYTRPSLPMQFWRKLCNEIIRGNVSHAIYLAYSLEQLQQCQKPGWIPMTNFPICFPDKRIAFIDEDGKKQTSPTHANAIIYIPGSNDCTGMFKQVFSQLGHVKI